MGRVAKTCTKVKVALLQHISTQVKSGNPKSYLRVKKVFGKKAAQVLSTWVFVLR